MYFEVVATYKEVEDEQHKGRFLIEAESLEEAIIEAKCKLINNGRQDVDARAAVISKYAEIVETANGEKYWEAKVVQPPLNGKGAKMTWFMLVNANSNDEAQAAIKEQLLQGYDNFEIEATRLTKIEGVL